MKRKSLISIFITLMMLCLSMFVIVGCSEKPATLETVTITNKTELAAEWHIGDADRAVTVAFAPDSFTADNTSVVLTSDNRDAVVADGMVLKAVGLGKAKITATADGKTDTVDVEVLPKLTGIAITNKNVLTSVWYIGDDARMVEVKLSPDDFTLENTDVQITSSNPQVIKAEGKTLTALAEGTSTITAKAGEFSDTVDVTVSVPELTGISINEADLKKPWTVGDADREVVVTYDPASIYNNENTPYTITSDNTSAVTVIENKKIHAVACGEAKITVVAGNKTAEVTINVRPALESVSISNEAALKAKWVIGDAARTVEVSLAPSDCYSSENTTVEITSSNEQAIVVSGKTLTAIGLGKSTITVTAGDKTAEIELEVVKPDLTKIAIGNKEELNAKWAVGDATRTLNINYTPHNYYNDDNTTVTVSSSNTSAITVSGKTLTAAGVGTSTITVTYGTGENALTDSVEITVVRPDITSVTITNKDDFTADWQMNSGTKSLTISLAPAEYYSLADVEVISSDSNIVSINKTNDAVTLTAVGGGEATITVKVGSRQDSVEITVVRPDITSVTITNKDDFTADWQMNSGTKSLTISLAPAEYYSLADVEVISSDSNIVSINKTNDAVTLTAVSVGEATITVKVGSRQDNVTINVVRPALTSLSITSEKTLNWTLDGSNSATISVSFDPEDYYSAVDVTVTASGDNIVTTDGLTITANGNVGTATITVAYKDDATIKDTITVTTTVSNPSIELSGNGVTLIQDGDKQGQYQLNGLHGATISLPTVNKAACDNRDDNIILDDLVLSDTEKMALDNNELTVSEKGEFTVTYTVKDSRDETKTATVTLNISIFRKVLADNGDYSMKEGCAFVEDDKQVVVGSNTGISFVPFNVQPSKNYYAEVTFDSKYFLSADGGWWDSGIGMGHFLPNVSGRLLMSYVDKAKTHKVKDFNTTVNWETDETKDASIIYSYKLDEFRGIVFNTADDNTPNTVKYAIARIGDDFFCFVNDVYVCSVSPELYRNSDTIPGIFAVAMKNDNGNTEATKISYVFDAEAKTKVSSLLKGGSGVASAYVPNEYYLGSKVEGNFTVNVATDERGANFDVNGDNDNKKDYNSSCVSPYVYFDGDFALEWEYKPTWTSHEFGTGNTGSIFELRSINYWSELNKFGVRFFWDGSTPVVQFIAHRPQEDQFGWTNESAKYAQSSTEYQNLMNYGVKMRVTRKITDGKATITYTVIPFIDANKTEGQVLFEVTQANIDQSNFGNNYQIATEALQFVWHNMETAGEYSNIRWAHTATPDWMRLS